MATTPKTLPPAGLDRGGFKEKAQPLGMVLLTADQYRKLCLLIDAATMGAKGEDAERALAEAKGIRPLMSTRLQPREFAAKGDEGGSLGWSLSDKADVDTGVVDSKAKCQVGLNITVVGSKHLPK